MKVKLLDTGLMRCFGGIIVDMTESQAKKYVDGNKAIYLENNINKEEGEYTFKSINHPSENKMVWVPPEEKIFVDKPIKDDMIVTDDNPYPKQNDALFSHIK